MKVFTIQNLIFVYFLTATNIFRKISWIKESVKILKKNDKYDSAFSVHKIYKHFGITKIKN